MVILDKNARALCGERRFTTRSSSRLFTVVLLLCAAFSAQAQDCSDYVNGTLDGFAGDVAPSRLQIDLICAVRNYPASNPLGTNFSFFTQPGQTNERRFITAYWKSSGTDEIAP